MIYLECYPDEALLRILGIPVKKIHHAGNKGNVCKRLEKSTNSKGLVDEDPLSTQPSYIKKLKLHSNEKSIRLLHDESVKNYLIILCPRLEEWILKAARESGLNIKNYGLPNKADELHKVINVRLEKYENLISDLKNRKSRMLKTLESFLKK
jgi:hypothetical protein